MHVGLAAALLGVLHHREQDQVVVDLATVVLEDGRRLLDQLDWKSFQLLL